jgi:hypothetical protein
MNKNSIITYTVILLIGVFYISIYSCKKSANTETFNTSNKITLTENKISKSQIIEDRYAFGNNVKRITNLEYNDKILSILKVSTEWQTILLKYNLNKNKITRTELVNDSSISLITIPIIVNSNEKEYFNIYVQNEKYIITRLLEVKNNNGLNTYKIMSYSNKLYYQFDLNSKNQIGNWKFENDMPKIFQKTSSYTTTQLETDNTGSCSGKTFNDCMNCLIVQICGSNWVCTIACGLELPSCIGAAVAVCLFS